MGEALVSVLDEKGTPTVVDKAGILPPRSSMKTAPEEVVRRAIDESPLLSKYADTLDRRSAYEALEEVRARETARAEEEARRATSTRSTSRRQDPLEKVINSTANTVGRELGKQIVRGLFGTFRK